MQIIDKTTLTVVSDERQAYERRNLDMNNIKALTGLVTFIMTKKHA